mmetsp:Transcript_24169/g.29297  ORF Transcript_24169/g.29297 Transcript_24169/m.29297 type:complete len:355 (-) Transcript_24169:656-1720(-)|eukprot:CAMPEP_0197852304 /NCGR_PEP_ID=MMETSP1438-20131217/20216_1 /TAXON_ID=1461541 /ORGANISM="Pterosperma sp., Strain CCMP1384" /LENGTH=354 /DNA_ID=CAMNT_0043466287 /DNA_START=152 /DNA_END=1216 /DNA_ORIENTATION=+
MPIVTSVCFANTKGGCGKSTLLFQIAAGYAKENPDVDVIILDSTRVGDISMSCLGGSEKLADQGDGKEVAKGMWFTQQMSYQNVGTFTNLVHEALQAQTQPTSFMQAMFGARAAQAPQLNLNSKCFNVCYANKFMPENVWLACGGTIDLEGTVQSQCATPEARKKIVETLKAGFEKSDKKWAIFSDTDGDLDFTPYTKICIGLADKIFIPYEISQNDILRFSNFFWPRLNQMAASGELTKPPQVHFLWNKVSVTKWAEAGKFSPNFKSPKEKESDIQSMQEILAKMVLGDATKYMDIPHAVIPPLESSGIKSMRTGCPLVCMGPSTVKLDNDKLLRVVADLVQLASTQPKTLHF